MSAGLLASQPHMIMTLRSRIALTPLNEANCRCICDGAIPTRVAVRMRIVLMLDEGSSNDILTVEAATPEQES